MPTGSGRPRRRLTPALAKGVALAHSVTALASPAVAPAQEPAEPAAWKWAAYVDAYLDPEESTYFVPTVFADRGRLHLEGRYNYEDFDTGSLFAGWTFVFGRSTEYLKLTPMVGAFVGRSNGVAPGLEVEARWWRLAYWLESEYAFDVEDASENFFYSWSELNLYLFPFLWVGGSLQRLKLVDTSREVDVGPMIGFGNVGRPHVSLSLYGYGLGTSARWFLATLALEF